MMRIGLVRGLVALLLLPGISHALGLGDVHLNSPLNAPLDAEIELVNATPEDLATLDAKLATKDTFARYGLDGRRSWPA
jgi:pilus assembly protein FimV